MWVPRLGRNEQPLPLEVNTGLGYQAPTPLLGDIIIFYNKISLNIIWLKFLLKAKQEVNQFYFIER